MTAETSLWKRFVALVASLFELVRDGGRSVEGICRVLQVVKDDANFEERFFGKSRAEADLTTESQLAEWQALYREEFGIEIDPQTIRIPERKSGFNWLIVVVPMLTMNQIFAACAKWFTCLKYQDDQDDLNVIFLRKATEPYALWVRDRVEADEELKGLSADAITELGIETADLRERTLLGLAYYRRTRKHLDLKSWTLCPLSRAPNGVVSCVSLNQWYDPAVHVHHWFSDDPNENVRARQAVL